jgi:hypothetical protein
VAHIAAFADKVSVTHILAGAADSTNFANGVGLLILSSLDECDVSVQAGNAARRLSEDRARTGEERKQDLFAEHL